MTRLRLRFIQTFACVAITGIALSPVGFAADSKAPSPEALAPAVQLSPYEVSAQTMEFQKWLKLSSPHFVVYTDASKKAAIEIVKQMEMLHQATQFFLKRKSVSLAPLIVILPNSRSDWRKINHRGSVEWKVATSLVGSTRQVLLAEYDWQSDDLGSVWAMVARQEVNAMNLDGPMWFTRGITNFFATVEFDRDRLTIGKQGFDAYVIAREGWLKWDKFFRITSTSPEFLRDTPEHKRYESQCTLFTHYLLTNSDPVWTSRLLNWGAYTAAGNEPTEEAFKTVFGEDWKAFENRVNSLLHGGSYTVGNIRFPPAALDFPIVTVDFPPREMRELFVLAQILNQNVKESDIALESILQHGLKTESLRELLADACQRRRKGTAYLGELRTLIASGTTNPAVYSEAAGTLLETSVPKRSPDARLAEETKEIRKWCKQALALEPLYVEANETLAWCEALAPTVESSNLETIAGICRRLDGNAPTDNALAAMAVARWRAGNMKQARTICERLANSFLCRPEPKKIAQDILTRLAATNQSVAPVTSGG
jgi:hypothetical protein